VDLYSTERGKWRSVDVYSRSCSELFARNAIFYLLLEFKEQKSGEERVIERMSKLLDDQSLSDVWFVVKGHEIGAHWAIVNSASHVMAAMFDPEQFKLSKRVVVDDTEPEVFKQLLRYIYTGTMPDLHEESMAEPLFLAADKYKIEGLKEECEKRLIFQLNLNNVIHLLVLAYTHSAANLLEATMKFISSNKKDIWPRLDWKDLVKQYPDLFFLASRRMNDVI
jgi:speckle-type POZ protein